MELLPELAVRQSYLEQAQLYQAHRWVVACLTEPSEQQLLQLIDADAEFSINGVSERGGASLLAEISDLRIKRLEPNVAANTLRIDGSCRLQSRPFEACVIEIAFQEDANDFPLITSVRITNQAGTPSMDVSISDTKMRSRVLALKHRWHALVEHPVKRAEPFREIITERFSMDWGKGSLSGYDALAEWVQSTAAIAAARHDIVAFDCREVDGQGAQQQYTALFEFAWSGLSQEGQPMQAQSEHRWLVIDDLTGRFARIDRMDVSFKVPFHVVGD